MNAVILTPYFLDQSQPQLQDVALPLWQINKPQLPTAALPQRLSTLHRPIADFVAAAARRGQRPVSFAGDCCTTLGVVAGLQRAGIDPLLLWLDAHGDFNTPQTTPSGFLGGMPLAMLVGLGDLAMAQALALRPLPAKDIILADGRDLDPGEEQLLHASDVQHFTSLEQLTAVDWGDRPIYIHFDSDIITPSEMPAAAYPAAGGPSAAALQSLFERLPDDQIAAISVTAWTPDLDSDGRSRQVVMQLVETLLATS